MSLNESIFHVLYGLAKNNILINILVVFFAEYFIYILALIALGLIFFTAESRRRYYFGALVSISVIISNGIVVPVLNYFFPNPRPFIALADQGVKSLVSYSTNSSMPSGHMMFIMSVALTVFYLNRKAGSWFLLGALLMGISRVAVGVHWPLDIIVGILLGALCFYGVKAMLYFGGLKMDSPAENLP